MLPILLHLLSATLYAGLCAWFWRYCSTENGGPARKNTSRGEHIVLLAAIITQGLALHSDLFPDNAMRFGFGIAVSLMIWLAVCFYWIESFYARLDSLHVMVLPAGLLGSLLPLIFPAPHILQNAGSPAFRVHFIVAMLAYSLFILAALHAALMAIAERQLHSGRISRLISTLPPLLTMEALLFRLIGIAFILLTLTLWSGTIFSEELFDKPFRIDHKTVFAFISWLLFGALLFGRHVWGWRGRIALRWTLAGFVALVLAYLGSRFVLEIVLGRMG